MRHGLFAVGLTLLGLAVLVGLPPAGVGGPVLLGDGATLPLGPWGLWYTAHHLASDGLHTVLVAAPDGGRIWPGAVVEGLLLAPLTWILGPALTWNLLGILRLVGAAFGGALLLRRLGLDGRWAVVIALSPALLQALAAGEALAPAVAWAPLAAVLLAGGWLPGAWLGCLLAATSPEAWVATLALVAVLWPRSFRMGGTWVALGLAALPWLMQLSTGVAGSTLSGVALSTEAVLSDERVGSLAGALGLGDGRPWGGPLLLGLVLLAGPARGSWRAVGLVALGVFAALGPALRLTGEPLLFAHRVVPLPLMLLDGLAPLSLMDDLAALGILAWVGLAVVLARWARGRSWPLLALPLLLAGPSVPWTAVRAPLIAGPTGPVLHYPFEQVPWTLLDQTTHGQPISAGPFGAASSLEALVRQATWTPFELQGWAREAGFATLVIDPAAQHGQALELSALLGADTLPLDGEPWPQIQLREHAFDNAQPIPALPEEVPHAPGDDWRWRDPVLEPLFSPELLGVALTQIRVYTSADGTSWTLRDTPVIHSLTTLGLTVVRDADGAEEALLISALSDFDNATGFHFRGTHPATVLALTTPDLQDWGLRRYELDAELAVVDPQIDHVDGRLVLTAWTTDRLGVDPMLLAGEHEVIVAEMGASGRFETRGTVFSAPRLADPTTAGPLLLFTQLELGATVRERVQVAAPGGGGLQIVSTVDDASVPFAWHDGTSWRLLVQANALSSAGGGGFSVMEARSEDGVVWGPLSLVEGLRPGPCESPVAAFFREEYLLICSERL